jgi:hypothetical protein
MADTKIQKALYGPSPWEVATGAILGILIGVFGACVYLVIKPVEMVKLMPKEPAPNVVYFVPGQESTTKSRGWHAKQKTFVEGGDVLLSEEELNAWAKELPTPAQNQKTPPKPGTTLTKVDPAKDKPADPDFLSATALNFRVKDKRLQISFKCTLDYYGIGKDVWVVATGGFARDGQHFVFDPETFYFGSCPLHRMPLISQFMAERFVSALHVSEDVRAALDKMTSASFDGDLLKISTKP